MGWENPPLSLGTSQLWRPLSLGTLILHPASTMDWDALELMTPFPHPSMGNQGPLSQPHVPLHRPGMSPACPPNVPQDPAPAPLRLTAAPALQVIPGPLLWGCEYPQVRLGVREEPCLALQHHSFPFSQKSAISEDAHTHTEPGSAWMGTTAPPVSAR